MPPRAVRSLKKKAHLLLPHYSLFVGKLPTDDSDAARHEVVTFVNSHLAARASLLEVLRQVNDIKGATRSELLSRTHFVLTSDVLSMTRVLRANVYGFQAKEVVKQEAQWGLISSVLHRWQAQVDHVILGGDFNAFLPPRLGFGPTPLCALQTRAQ